MIEYFYGDNGYSKKEFRWWRNIDPGDMFDIVTKDELDERIKSAQLLGHKVTDHLPAFCYDDECSDCAPYKRF